MVETTVEDLVDCLLCSIGFVSFFVSLAVWVRDGWGAWPAAVAGLVTMLVFAAPLVHAAARPSAR